MPIWCCSRGPSGRGGAKLINQDSGAWDTEAVLVDLVPADNDTIYGDAGDDVLFGQRGNDKIYGGDGNDTIFGDRASNTAAFATDLPLIMNTVLIIGQAAGLSFNLPAGGQLVVPAINLVPSALTPNSPQLELFQPGAGALYDLQQNTGLARADGSELAVYASVVTDIVHGGDALYGNDTIDGGNGNDTVFGDDGAIFAPIETGFATIDKEISGPVRVDAGDARQSRHAVLCGERVGGCGWALPARRSISPTATTRSPAATAPTPSSATPAGSSCRPPRNSISAAAACSRRPSASTRALQDMQQVVVDFAYTAHEATHDVINRYASVTQFSGAFVPGASPVRAATHRLVLGNDTIDAGAGDDLVVGDNGFVVLTAVQSTANAPVNGVSAATFSAVNSALVAQDKARDDQLAAHIAADHPENWHNHIGSADPKAQWLFDNGQPFALTVGNDAIKGGTGDDTLVGDKLVVLRPTLLSPVNKPGDAAGANVAINATLSAIIARLFKSGPSYGGAYTEAWGPFIQAPNSQDWSADAGYNFWWLKASSSDKRNAYYQPADFIKINSDTIDGGDRQRSPVRRQRHHRAEHRGERQYWCGRRHPRLCDRRVRACSLTMRRSTISGRSPPCTTPATSSSAAALPIPSTRTISRATTATTSCSASVAMT